MHLVELKFLTDAHKVHERTLAKRIRQSLIFWHAQHVHLELKKIYKKRFGTKRYRTLGFRDGRRNFKRVPEEPKPAKQVRLVEQDPVPTQTSVPTPELPHHIDYDEQGFVREPPRPVVDFGPYEVPTGFFPGAMTSSQRAIRFLLGYLRFRDDPSRDIIRNDYIRPKLG